ncbi:MAG: hypothetical protein ABI644_00270 [Arenimonas sp.]
MKGQTIPEPTAVELKPEQLERLVGDYGSDAQLQKIRFTEGKLIRQVGDGKAIILTSSSETTFFVSDQELRIRFYIKNGKALSLQVYEDGGDAKPLAKRRK